MNENLKPARLVPPGSIICDELEARGWTEKDLADIMGRPEQAVSDIVRRAKSITLQTARELAGALGPSPAFWLNLETNYRRRLAEGEQQTDSWIDLSTPRPAKDAA